MLCHNRKMDKEKNVKNASPTLTARCPELDYRTIRTCSIEGSHRHPSNTTCGLAKITRRWTLRHWKDALVPICYIIGSLNRHSNVASAFLTGMEHANDISNHIFLVSTRLWSEVRFRSNHTNHISRQSQFLGLIAGLVCSRNLLR